jgi:hypothetical protein
MLAALRRSLIEDAARVADRLRCHWTMLDLDRFSDRRLREIGFERDWDGSITPISQG